MRDLCVAYIGLLFNAQVVIDNWTNQPYQDNHGTNITEANNTIVVSALFCI